ncbi:MULTISPECIES: thioether cross-link-forming SCIFF peptide maturase [unclassified Fusibacter]|uniref:thioether cross-link-forming SCIFF peptide maturase n=1 Tax=unclassified Fusibacter TaxID=2624464 RepID=UPI0010130C48|nr:MULTISPECIES: thioether cross-link-forming SCIFF peptide maturase [unclassified Fusibacter]MCK8059058.1 thioether cross-link-forming SCIFF peptide maturase [Fusibacter sp. A2]NPE22467.1 thioether cross-link-forming SCIFF peptide maturase [Fusibacter sp. A1]RXV60571.1 thioether cross-link-forming SCIFF peptide maturase [Fusibacter sp. A1]
MIHQFKKNGWFFVLDVNSGAVHSVDELVYDLLPGYGKHSKEDIIKEFSGKYETSLIEDALGEIDTLKSENMLFTENTYVSSEKFLHREPVVKALCLHVAHDCNIRCEYCFAAQGNFEGERLLMPLEIGKNALKFLVERSGSRRQLEVDLFGGEPLMNWEVCKQLVTYGRELEKEYNKVIRFTLTTNGTLLDDEKIEYINENFHNVVLSIDGKKETNDKMRPTVNGKGTYDIIVPKFKKLIDGRGGKSYYVRGTFTRHNLEFDKDVIHLADLGFTETSVEPVVGDPNDPFTIREQDLVQVFESYDRLAEDMVSKLGTENAFRFFHFTIDFSQGPCLIKRVSGCGAGSEYLAITPEGDIYPCHQFVGNEDFKLGNITEKSFDNSMTSDFHEAHVENKEACKACWAKYYCSGGCHANAYNFNDSLFKPYEIGCEMEKKRIENAIYLQAETVTRGSKQ